MDYGAVASLKQTIERLLLLRSPQSLIVLQSSEIESLSEQLLHLQSFLDTIESLPSNSRVDASLERRIKDAANEFEDLIDFHISDLFLSASDQSSSDLTSTFSQQLQKVNREFTSLTKKLMNDQKDHSRCIETDYRIVDSFSETIDNLVRCSESSSEIVLSNSQIESLSEQLLHLQSYLDTAKSFPSRERVDACSKRRAKDALEELAYLIDICISDLFLSRLTSTFKQQFLQVKQDITSLTLKWITNEEEEEEEQYQQQLMNDFGEEKKEIGRLAEELKSWIFDRTKALSVMLIGGMAGIGKTSLARQVFHHPDVQCKFDCYSFVSVGPQMQDLDVMKLVLLHMSFPNGHENRRNCSIRQHFYNTLRKQKYLIVLDNMWNTHAWDLLQVFFPNNENGSRIILTSTLLDIETRLFWAQVMEVPFLDVDQSWCMLRKLVFTAEEEEAEQCSPELVKIGKKIAENCEGLPLAIIEVGKLLTKNEKTIENWKMIAESEDPLTVTMHDNTPLSKALSLSYMMLPQRLKVCFLYMAVFPKKYEIPRSRLIKLWVSEGILAPYGVGSVEKMAEKHLEELVSRSVVLINKLRSRGRRETKTCRLHFTFRSLCVNEANGEEFFCVVKKYADDSFPQVLNSQNRLCFHNNIVLGFIQVHSWMESIPNARTLLCFGPKQPYPIDLFLGSRLLQILDAVAIRFYEFPDQVLDLVLLRYLAITYDGELPSSISRLQNLEVLIISQHHNIKRSSNLPVYLPMEIWKLHNLKHFQCMGLDLPDPSSTDDDSLILEKLLTLSGVTAHSCTVGVLARTPNLMKIGIKIELAQDCVETFSFLGGDHFASLFKEFDSFKCVLESHSPVSFSSIPINFPENIRKITLSGCRFQWEYMSVIAALPNLEALKLRWYAFCGPMWEMNDERFRKLQCLHLEDLDIERWISRCYNFPALERLIIRHCYKLQEISHDLVCFCVMAEIDDCGYSLMKEMQEQKHHLRLRLSHLRVHFSGDDKKPRSELD